METRLTSEIVYDGRLLTVRRDEVRLPSGATSVREVVAHPGAVAVLPITDAGNIILVRQYRYAVQRDLLEVPAGTREPDESALDCARRELEEETGYRAGQVEELTRIFVSPGWCNEEIRIFRASSLLFFGAQPDEDEALETVEIRPARIPGLLRDGDVVDAKSTVALLTHLLL